jgi:DNA-binding transcriptional ArsR family regulator
VPRREQGRNTRLADTILVFRWLADRQASFTVHDLTAAMGVRKRTSYRWLSTLEGAGLIEVEAPAHDSTPARWRSMVRIVSVGIRTRMSA